MPTNETTAKNGNCRFDRTWECLESDEFAILVRDTVAKLLDVRPDDLPKADEAKITNAMMQVCTEINCQVAPAGNA